MTNRETVMLQRRVCDQRRSLVAQPRGYASQPGLPGSTPNSRSPKRRLALGAASESPGGKTIAHGLLSLSLIPTLIRDIIGLKVVKNTLNYGANRVRYLTPVPAGARLRGRVEVMAAEDVPPNALRVTYKVTIEIEGGKRPACVAEVIGQHYR